LSGNLIFFCASFCGRKKLLYFKEEAVTPSQLAAEKAKPYERPLSFFLEIQIDSYL